MNRRWQVFFLLFYAACSPNKKEVIKPAEANFRITLNNNRDLTEAESDSIENSHPFFTGTTQENRLYDILVRKGFVSDQQLDTSGLNFLPITLENPTILFLDMAIELDTSEGRDCLIARKGKRTEKIELGERLLGDRFISYLDIDEDGKADVLVMEKYYVMGGYNFDLKLLDF
jgi:hypothetical protein